jgi:hypothetical protein
MEASAVYGWPDSKEFVTSILNPDNRLFTLARLGRRPPSALAAIAVVFVMLALVLILGQMLARLVPLFPSGIQSVTNPISEIIGFLSIYLACGSAFDSGANVLSGH